MRLFKVLFVFLILINIACVPDEPIENNLDLFNIKKYFLTEIEQLESKKASLEKTLINNTENVEETLNFDEPQWKNEFQLFLESDVSNKAIADKYKIDTIKSIIIYKALQDDVSVKKLQLDYTSGNFKEIWKISILKSSNNIISNLEQELIYTSGKNYSISVKQKMPFAEEYKLNCTGKIY